MEVSTVVYQLTVLLFKTHIDSFWDYSQFQLYEEEWNGQYNLT